jgi:predicted CopG family antitoxin
MKTITLTNEAYERLNEWKQSEDDSPSDIVLRVIPKRGTLADLLESFQQLPPLTEEQAILMEETVVWANDWANVSMLSSGKEKFLPETD